MTTPVTVQLGGKDVRLEAPRSYTVRTDIVLLERRNRLRAMMAALGVCWRGASRPKVTYDQAGWDPAAYGGAVLDELVERGIAPAEAFRAGAEAMGLILDGWVWEPELEQAEGNSDGEEAETG